MGSYDTAQICVNGHIITSSANNSPELKQEYCDKCGERTITKCENCNSRIKGYYRVPGFIGFSDYEKPKFCDSCGDPYPWTKKQIDAANELVEFTEDLEEEEKEELKGSIKDLLREGPNTEVAQLKFKKYASEAGKEVANGLKDILVDLVSETVKKAIWGN